MLLHLTSPDHHTHRHPTTRAAAAAVATLDASHRETLASLTHAADALHTTETHAHHAARAVMHAVHMLCRQGDIMDNTGTSVHPLHTQGGGGVQPHEGTLIYTQGAPLVQPPEDDGAVGVLVSVCHFASQLHMAATIVHVCVAQAAGVVAPHVWESAVDTLCTQTVRVGRGLL